MSKRLALKYWPLALLFVLIVAVLCMSYYAEHRKAENQEYAQASSPKPTVSPLEADKRPKPTNKPKYPPSWVDTFAWPEGVTTWGLFLTLFVIAWQSVETHAAAEATAAGVEAAKRQTDLIREQMNTQIHRERARLNLEVQPIEIPESRFDDGVNLRSCIELTNSGHSNAFINLAPPGLCWLVLDSSLFWKQTPMISRLFLTRLNPLKSLSIAPSRVSISRSELKISVRTWQTVSVTSTCMGLLNTRRWGLDGTEISGTSGK